MRTYCWDNEYSIAESVSDDVGTSGEQQEASCSTVNNLLQQMKTEYKQKQKILPFQSSSFLISASGWSASLAIWAPVHISGECKADFNVTWLFCSAVFFAGVEQLRIIQFFSKWVWGGWVEGGGGVGRGYMKLRFHIYLPEHSRESWSCVQFPSYSRWWGVL